MSYWWRVLRFGVSFNDKSFSDLIFVIFGTYCIVAAIFDFIVQLSFIHLSWMLNMGLSIRSGRRISGATVKKSFVLIFHFCSFSFRILLLGFKFLLIWNVSKLFITPFSITNIALDCFVVISIYAIEIPILMIIFSLKFKKGWNYMRGKDNM